MKSRDEPRPVRRVRSAWSDVVLVCRKCSKKIHGGFGQDDDQGLAKELRRYLRATTGDRGKGRRATVGIVEVGCFDVCPKNAVVAVRAASPGEWLVIPKGTPIGDAAARLGQATAEAESSA